MIELGDETFRLKKSLETASKIGARFAIILGENEAKSNEFALKNLATGQQETVPRAELVVAWNPGREVKRWVIPGECQCHSKQL